MLQHTIKPLSLRPDQNDCSLVLDLARFVAAQAVCFGHAISIFGVYPGIQPPNVPYMQNIAVLVFFVLSGFVIAHTLIANSERVGYGISEYLIERFARIYSAYLPALIFISLVDYSLFHLGIYEYYQHLSLKAFVGNLFMLQNCPGPYKAVLNVPSLGSAGQLWVVPVLFHTYLFMGAWFFLRASRAYLVLMALIFFSSFVPLNYLYGDVQPSVGTGLFSLWLMGFITYLLNRNEFLSNVPSPAIATVTLAFFFLYVAQVTPGSEYVPMQYVFFAGGFLGLTNITLHTRVTTRQFGLQKAVRRMADYSFSLYLLHYTILYACKQLWSGDSMIGMWTAFLLSNAIAFLFARFTEMKYRDLARWMKERLSSR